MTLRFAWPRFSAALVATAAIYSSGGCSFFYDLNTTQCEVTADCRAFGSQFRTTTCVNRVCVEAGSNETGGSTSGGSTSGGSGNGKGGTGGNGTSGEMGEGGIVGQGGTGGADGGMGGEGGGEPPPECTTNTECIEANLDAPYICRNQKCVGLITPQCPVLVPLDGAVTILKDRIPPIVLGGFARMDNVSKPEDTKAVINWNLAFSEFDTVLGIASNRARVLGLICQGYGPLVELAPSMTHLTQEVGTPAILSSALTSDHLAEAWEFTQTPEYIESMEPPANGGVSAPSVFFMSTASADLRLANLDDSGMVWHQLGDPRGLAATTAALVKRIEPYVQTMRQSFYDNNPTLPGREDPSTPMRVTLVSVDEPTMSDVAKVLTTTDTAHPENTLMFNGLNATAAGNIGNFRQVAVESISTHGAPVVSNGIAELQQNPPHIIVAMGTGEFSTIMSTVEANWGKSNAPNTAGVPRPFYVLSHFIYSASLGFEAPMAMYAGMTPPLNMRSVGVNYALAQDTHSKQLYDDYLAALDLSYSGTLSIAGSENHYDGAYGLLYAVMAAAPFTANKPDGIAIRNGWQQRVIAPTGTSIDIGYAKLADTIGRFSSSTFKMALWGTMGPPNFDFLSGTRLSATSAWCMQLKSGSTTVWQVQIDGLIYDAKAKVFNNPASPATVPTCLAQY